MEFLFSIPRSESEQTLRFRVSIHSNASVIVRVLINMFEFVNRVLCRWSRGHTPSETYKTTHIWVESANRPANLIPASTATQRR